MKYTFLMVLALTLSGTARAGSLGDYSGVTQELIEDGKEAIGTNTVSSLDVYVDSLRHKSDTKAFANMRKRVSSPAEVGTPSSTLQTVISVTEQGMKNSSEGSHETSLRVMGGLDRKIAAGEKIPWSSLPENYQKYYSFLVLRMQSLFYSDGCSTYFNTELEHWTSCCKLGLSSADNLSFCGIHVFLKLPIPCRTPELGFDYGIKFPNRIAKHENPTSANDGVWSCNAEATQTPEATQAPEAPEETQKATLAPEATPISVSWYQLSRLGQRGSSLPQNVKEFMEITDTFTIEVTPVYETSTNTCGAGSYVPMSTCYPACCDSSIMYTQFCVEQGQKCF